MGSEKSALENLALEKGSYMSIVSKVDPLFWKGRRVLITGHTGFKGSWLSLWLQEWGAKLCGVSLPPNTSPNLFELADVSAHMETHFLDIRDLSSLKNIFTHFEPEIVLHLAAQPLVRYSYEAPVETYQTNVMGTVNVLEVARHMDSVKAVLNVTTDKCYENREWVWPYRENEPMGGYDPYSNSKGCSELVTQAYLQSFYQKVGKGLASARAGNVIGGGDWSLDRLIPDIMNSLVQKQPVIIRNPKAIRPWQHVLEPLSGYLLLAQRVYEDPMKYSQPWNFGPHIQDAVNVQTMVEQVFEKWGGDHAGMTIQKDEKAPHEAQYLKLDISKAETLLEWRPRLNLSMTLSWVCHWYQSWLRKENMRDVTTQQIAKFESLQSEKMK